MVKERYCSSEVARLLREKGFDEECTCLYYNGDLEFANDNVYEHVVRNSSIANKDFITAPTHQMACDWLAEKYHLFFKVGFGNDIEGDFLYMVDIYDLTDSAVYGRYMPMVEADDYLKSNPKTVGDAIEEALKYSLEKIV